MSASEDIRQWLIANGLTTGYTLQYGRWNDKPSERLIVVFPDGGTVHGSLEERPNVRLLIMGKQNDNAVELEAHANAIIETARDNFSHGDLALIQPVNTPIGPGFTEKSQPFFQINLTTIK